MSIDFQTLAIISVLTALTTQCVKTFCRKKMLAYVSNIIASVVSVILSFAIVVIKPMIMDGVPLSPQLIFSGVTMAFFGVLCATLSFEKVKEALEKIKG